MTSLLVVDLARVMRDAGLDLQSGLDMANRLNFDTALLLVNKLGFQVSWRCSLGPTTMDGGRWGATWCPVLN